VRVLLFCE